MSMARKAHHGHKVGIVHATLAATFCVLKFIISIFPHVLRIFVNDKRRCGAAVLVLSKDDADIVRIVMVAGLLEAICAGLMDESSGICRVSGGGSGCRSSSQCSGDCYDHSLSPSAGHHGGIRSAVLFRGAKVGDLRFDDLPL